MNLPITVSIQVLVEGLKNGSYQPQAGLQCLSSTCLRGSGYYPLANSPRCKVITGRRKTVYATAKLRMLVHVRESVWEKTRPNTLESQLSHVPSSVLPTEGLSMKQLKRVCNALAQNDRFKSQIFFLLNEQKVVEFLPELLSLLRISKPVLD